MPFDDLILFPVFESLRKQGVPLGISEYLVVIDALRQGYGNDKLEKIEQLCRLVWTKSVEDQEIFDLEFTRLARPRLQSQLLPGDKTSEKRTEEKGRNDDWSEKRAESGSHGNETRIVEKEQEYNDEYPVTLDHVSSRGWDDSGDNLLVVASKRFQLTPRMPIGIREMATAWRHMRLSQRSGPAVELDVDGTIDDISQRGLFLGPRMQPRRRNQADLLVLMDVSESMAPYSLLMETLLESILRVGLLDQVDVYYFQEYPGKIFYEQPGLSGEIQLDDLLRVHATRRGTLIVSEIGAASSTFSSKRLSNIHAFLTALETVTYLYAWLNPLPTGRWQGNTAGEVARLVPMFPIDRDGINDAVNILRGYPFPHNVSLSKGNLDAISP